MQFNLSLGKTLPISILAMLGVVARAQAGGCPDLATPVWSYTPPEGTDAIFRGTTDSDGNLYWIEFQKFLGTQQLVSASRDGSIRYRNDFDRASRDRYLDTLGAVLADGMVLVATEEHHVRAFDAQTGALVWDTAVGSSGSYYGVLTDTGTGVVVVSYGGQMSAVDLATGAELWTNSGESSVAAVSGNIYAKRVVDGQSFLIKIDPSGMDIWSEPVSEHSYDGFPIAVLGGETPLIYSARGEILIQEKWWEVPGTGVVVGADFGFLLSWRVNRFLLQSFNAADGRIIGEQTLVTGDGRITFGGVPLLTPDHLLFPSQEAVSNPGLCHPLRFQQAKVAAWSKQADQLFSCDLPDLGEAAIEGASLYDGSLVVARRHYFTGACTSQIQPLIIEAYNLPGEELADQGWVMPAGNPAQSRRSVQ